MLEKRYSSSSFGGVHTVEVPKALEATYAIGKLMLRPFGIDESDLEVDFSRPPGPALVTDILECCTTVRDGRSADRNLLWALQVSTRIEWLLRIISLSGAFDAALLMKCLNEACGETVEVELSLDDFLGLQRDPTDFISVDCEEQTLDLRKPNGLDQLGWATNEFESERAAIETMVQTLIVSDDDSQRVRDISSLDDDALLTIDRAMQESDSLVDFSLEVVCPYCEEKSEFDLDLQELAIGHLKQLQRRLLTIVHRLARHYHWSEQQIFAVPHWRRIYYLKLLEEGRI